MEELTGGREGMIFRQGNTVVRPASPWSDTIRRLLAHLHERGFDQCPRFISRDDNRETLTFVAGDTYNDPFEGPISTQTALTSAAQLLRKLHDHTQSFIEQNDVTQLVWMLPPRDPQEVVCHGDYAPYNAALQGDRVVGVFDFDTAHPAPRVWDLAYAVYRWAPLSQDVPAGFSSLELQIGRAVLFCNSYGATQEMRAKLVGTIAERLEAMVAYIKREAAAGDLKFQQDLAEGHHLIYQADIDYLRSNSHAITLELLADF